ncbi:hypothetical protein [Nocardiopsis synnemataformans]|uniref:hypothetical protein n=1 Tax=Nocardiopsis synnemataformans TaxID=61305 RepID=UPI003EBD186F
MKLTDLDPELRFDLRHLHGDEPLIVPAADGEPLTATPTPTPLYWHIRDVGPVSIQLAEMLFNWRITISLLTEPWFIEGAWCYFGRDWQSFSRAVRAAYAFDPTTQDAPQGFDKAALPWSAAALRRT